ncbi:hypothetical protein [Arthrobacter sp. H5]|uniref:hypothetical protein n=1 Tax=Arthrobacter sp. H5 TaxID=1267973 RepID=UPI000482DCA7|nr:hypothetical protein [Arthrobacter sp. H5]
MPVSEWLIEQPKVCFNIHIAPVPPIAAINELHHIRMSHEVGAGARIARSTRGGLWTSKPLRRFAGVGFPEPSAINDSKLPQTICLIYQ